MGRIHKGLAIDSALRKKGFRRETDGDHICYILAGTDIKTKISHGMTGRDIGPELLGLMARQLRLTKNQFLDLIDCHLDEEGYRVILRESDFAV